MVSHEFGAAAVEVVRGEGVIAGALLWNFDLRRVKIESNGKPYPIPGAAVVSLSRWLEHVGVTTCTAWRWRKRGWLKTVNIAGRQYLTREAIDEFHRRASAGEFSQVYKVPAHKEAGVGG